MARVKVGDEPVPDPFAGKEALDMHLPIVLRGRGLEEAGWIRPDNLTLLVPLFGRKDDGSGDLFLLKLYFGCYPTWPPSAQFINPMTAKYSPATDLGWLPRIEGTDQIAVHENYNGIQLICSSVTLEFYQVKHDVKDEHLWDPDHQNFAATLTAIRFGLRPEYYKGPKGVRS